jgi:Ca-activated chloride channel family protein
MTRQQAIPAVLVSVCALVGGLSVAGPGTAGPWVSGDGTTPELRLTEVSYEVDVFGTLATGTLVQSFVNESGEILTARYQVSELRGLLTKSVTLEVDGEAVKAEEQGKTRGGARRRGTIRPGRPAGPEAEVEPFETVSVRVAFEAHLGISEGTFHLRLPAPSSPPPGDRPEPDAPAAEPEAEVQTELSAAVRVVLHHQDPPRFVQSPSHDIYTDYGDERTVIELSTAPGLDGRDFELDFRFGETEEPSLQGFVKKVDDDVHQITAVLTPPSEPIEEAARDKQMILILDTSGSMAQASKLDRAREALIATLDQLRGTETFNVIEFDETQSTMFGRPMPASAENFDSAREWLDEQEARGGTKLLRALQVAFEQPEDPERHRMVTVLSDGQIHDKKEVEQLLQENRDRFRVFFVGVGEDVDEMTLRRFAEICRGTAAVTRESDDLDATTAVLIDSVSRPLVWDLELDFGGAEVEWEGPEILPDLYAGRAVTVNVRVRGELPATLTLHGSTVEGDRTFSVVLPDPTEESYLQGEAAQP